jgi:hypothetical protein
VSSENEKKLRKPPSPLIKQNHQPRREVDTSSRSDSKSSRSSGKAAKVEWLVKVYTSDIRDKTRESTDSNVYISFIGESVESGEEEETERLWLARDNLKHKTRDLFRALFEQGHTDEFLVTPKTRLSSVHKIRIGHDNSGLSPGWHLQKVELIDQSRSGAVFTFLCNRWLSSGQDDRKIERVLSLHTGVNSGRDKPPPPVSGDASHRSANSNGSKKSSGRKDAGGHFMDSASDEDSLFSKQSKASNKSAKSQNSAVVSKQGKDRTFYFLRIEIINWN